jgi:hypothetical protein
MFHRKSSELVKPVYRLRLARARRVTTCLVEHPAAGSPHKAKHRRLERRCRNVCSRDEATLPHEAAKVAAELALCFLSVRARDPTSLR